VKGIGGEGELFERDGTEQRITSGRPSEKDRRPLSVPQSDPDFSRAVNDPFAAREHC
jgi:hypothetical protein